MKVYIRAIILSLLVMGCNISSNFDLASRGNVVTLEKLLLKNNSNIINSKDNWGKTMMHYAVCDGNKSILELLYRYGAELDIPDETGMTPLHVCAMWDRKGPARWLVEHGANLQLKDEFGDTALHTSAVFGSINTGKYLLGIGMSLNEKNAKGLTPIDLAIKYRNHDWLHEVGGK
ncbi:MAG TPA: ankyrin repeat domain-containing protein [Candidatus Hydrogenedens sp.]|nr:ankyrin repeat domain-containing protein [Candidatus Hydrogenedens sp.]